MDQEQRFSKPDAAARLNRICEVTQHEFYLNDKLQTVLGCAMTTLIILSVIASVLIGGVNLIGGGLENDMEGY
jgi:hypothetical protein